MSFVLIGLAAFVASLLTFFSGFGLGTLLLPVFAIFFPIEVAIALTGVVHLLNNFFKMSLIGQHANWDVVLKFGLPALLGAYVGAQCLARFAGFPPVAVYALFGKTCTVTPVKLLVAALMVAFALFELVAYLKTINFSKDNLLLGGLLSGFFGGISGHQGALRSAFLLRFGLEKTAFIATGIYIATFVDLARLSIYFNRMTQGGLLENWRPLAVAVVCAFTGALMGNRLLQKTTLGFIQKLTAVMILLLALALGAGVI
jgi:hypothetical protein